MAPKAIFTPHQLKILTFDQLLSIKIEMGLEPKFSNRYIEECRFMKPVILYILDSIQISVSKGNIKTKDIKRFFSKSVYLFFESPVKNADPYDTFLDRYDTLRNFFESDFNGKSIQHTNTLDFISLFNGFYGYKGAILGERLKDFLPNYDYPYELI